MSVARIEALLTGATVLLLGWRPGKTLLAVRQALFHR
jgi:hypothetical protein